MGFVSNENVNTFNPKRRRAMVNRQFFFIIQHRMSLASRLIAGPPGAIEKRKYNFFSLAKAKAMVQKSK
jgi:hypothetical protein